MKIIPLCEGIFSINKEKKIDLAKQDIYQQYICPPDCMLMAIRPFLVRTKDHCILLDTGLGSINPLTKKYTLIEELENYNLSADHVDIVLLSHLHADHIGTIFLPQSNTLTFPNATYYIQEKEYAWANEKYIYFKESINYKNLHFSDQICWLSEPQGILKNNIEYFVSGGHTPYHQVFWIRENESCTFFGGDVSPQYKQMFTNINARYDYDPKQSTAHRMRWAEEGKKEHWNILFYHDIKHDKEQF